jgi:transposase
VHRYELTDAQWECIAPLLPDSSHGGQPGRPWHQHRRIVNGILWHLHTGAPWRDLPERYGPWQTVYDRFNFWCRDGTWATLLDALLLRLDKAGRIDRDLWLVDASLIRATRAAAGAKKKSRAAAAFGRAGVDASTGTPRSCAGTFAGGLRHEGPSGL